MKHIVSRLKNFARAFPAPKITLPKFASPHIALPKMPWLKSRKLIIGASVLALIVAGGLAWFIVRPMLTPATAAREAAGAPEEIKPDKAEAPNTEALREPAPEKAQEQPKVKPENPEPEKQKTGDGAKLAAGPPPPLDPLDEPEILIRRLQDLQERVARGDAASYAEQPQLLHLIAQRFEAQPPEIWAKRQDARALILYLLSGGASSVGRKILDAHHFAATETPLAKGAIAYLEGVDGVDRDTLLNLDPLALDVSLGAHVAFVQSILLAGFDRAKAVAKLDLARLLVPGGLVEEAALRREAGLLSETAEFDKFAGLSRQYWERFRNSPYAANFLRQFLLSAARVSLRIQVAEWTQLDAVINSLKPETRRALYLVMAQTAAVGGNFALGDMAAGRVLDLSPENSVERQRALLFRAVARVGAADFAHRPALLREVDRARLPSGDQPLYDAAALVSARIFRARRQKHGEKNAMSAMALVPQDTAGLSAFIGRKTPSGGSQDDDPDADFNAALAQTADASPAPKTHTTKTLAPATPAATPRVKSDDDIWRTLAALYGEAKPPQTASGAQVLPAQAPSVLASSVLASSEQAVSAQASNTQGDLPGAATRDVFSCPALDPKPAPTSKPQATEDSHRADASVPTKADATPDSAPVSAPALGSDAAPVSPSRAASSIATSSLSSASIAPERFFRAPDKTAEEKHAPLTIDRAPKAEAEPSTICPSNPPAACTDSGLASALNLPPAQKSESAATGPTTDQDAVARIGAALACPAAQGAGGAQMPAASDPGLKEAKLSEVTSEGTTTSVHVVAQQTWLQPVSPVFSPGLRRQAAADRAALETPPAVVGKSVNFADGNTVGPSGGKTENTARGKIEVGGKVAPAAVTNSPAPSAVSAPEKAPQTPSSFPCSPGGGNLVSDKSEAPKPAAAATPSPSDEVPRGLAATPRKNLEITLAPRGTGRSGCAHEKRRRPARTGLCRRPGRNRTHDFRQERRADKPVAGRRTGPRRHRHQFRRVGPGRERRGAARRRQAAQSFGR
jgi:chemotaxis protein MotC